MANIDHPEQVSQNQKLALTAQWGITGASFFCTIAILAWLLWYCRYGFDFTDESFYLIWISRPFDYKVSASQFGFVYHPLYELVGGQIALLRQANVLITFGLSWFLAAVFIKTMFGSQSMAPVQRLAVSSSIATGSLVSLVFAGMWLATPSYNTLALQGLLLGAIGMLWANRQKTIESHAGWILIGVGGWLTFMAKPTSAAALAAIVGFYVLFSGKFSVRMIAISIATTLFLLGASAFAIDGSVSGFIDRLRGGLETANMIVGGQISAGIFRFDNIVLGERAKQLLNSATLLFFLTGYLFSLNHRMAISGAVFLSCLLVALTLATISGADFPFLSHRAGMFQGILLSAVPFAALLLGLSINRLKGVSSIPLTAWATGIAFLFLPYAYTFGTNNNYWVLATGAAIFWVLAGLVLLVSAESQNRLPHLLLPIGLAAQLATVVLIESGLATPYRQPQPLQNNDYKIEIGDRHSALIVSSGYGHYLADALGAADHAGFKPGTPMIDLTGRSPGILLALGARSIGQAWILGGYPGSERLASAMLKKVSCDDLSSAWLLIEPPGRGTIPPQVLASFGASLFDDFRTVGEFTSAPGAGNNKDAIQQLILKPTRSLATARAACVEAKQ